MDGLAKRIDRVLNPDELRRRLTALLAQDRLAAATVPDIEVRRREIEGKIARLVDALADGPSCGRSYTASRSTRRRGARSYAGTVCRALTAYL
jgi:hypothetical protein